MSRSVCEIASRFDAQRPSTDWLRTIELSVKAYLHSDRDRPAAEFLLAYYYYGHTNTTVDLAALPAGVVDALSLDDPTILEEPRSHPETWIPRRDIYSQYWGEVLAS